MSNLARFAITSSRKLDELEIQVEDGEGGWVLVDILSVGEVYGTLYKADVTATPGEVYRVRYKEIQAGQPTAFSDWTVPGVVVVPEPTIQMSFIIGIVLIEWMRRMKTTRRRDMIGTTLRFLLLSACLIGIMATTACQTTSDFTEGRFSTNFGDGKIDATEGTIESKGLSIPGMELLSKLVDVGIDIATAVMPGFVGNAIAPPPAAVPDHTHPVSPPAQPVLINGSHYRY